MKGLAVVSVVAHPPRYAGKFNVPIQPQCLKRILVSLENQTILDKVCSLPDSPFYCQPKRN